MNNKPKIEQCMSDCLIELPWGKDAVLSAVQDEGEVEIVLLQQSIIDNQQSKLNVLHHKNVELNKNLFALSCASEKSDGRIAELESLVKEKTDFALDIEGKLNQSALDLDVLEKTQNILIKQNHDQERKLEAVTYQKGVIQSELNKLRTSLNSTHKANQDLILENTRLTTEVGLIQKKLNQQQIEIDGIPTRIENAQATERARLSSNNNIDHQSRNEQIAILEQQLKIARKEKTQLCNENISAVSALKKEASLSDSLRNHAIKSSELTKVAISKLEEQASATNKLNKSMANLMAKFADQSIKFDQAKRENYYLSQILEYQELRTVWQHADGTSIYIIGVNPLKSISIEGAEDKHSLLHPVCWVMNANGTGHTLLLNDAHDTLLYPSVVTDTEFQLQAEHEVEVTEALKNIPLDKFDESLKASVARAQNISNAADLLDINWSENLNTDRLIKEVFEDGWSNADLNKLTAATANITKLAALHSKSLPKLTKKKKR